MAKFFSHWYNKALAALLVILGFGAFLYNSIRVMYGPPPTPVMNGPSPTVIDSIDDMIRKMDSLNHETENKPKIESYYVCTRKRSEGRSDLLSCR